jgi:hypothetical protein
MVVRNYVIVIFRSMLSLSNVIARAHLSFKKQICQEYVLRLRYDLFVKESKLLPINLLSDSYQELQYFNKDIQFALLLILIT